MARSTVRDGAHAGPADADDVDATSGGAGRRRGPVTSDPVVVARFSGHGRRPARRRRAARRRGALCSRAAWLMAAQAIRIRQQRIRAPRPDAARRTPDQEPARPHPISTSASCIAGLVVTGGAGQRDQDGRDATDPSSSATVMAPARSRRRLPRCRARASGPRRARPGSTAPGQPSARRPDRRPAPWAISKRLVVTPTGDVVERPVAARRPTASASSATAPLIRRAPREPPKRPRSGGPAGRPSALGPRTSPRASGPGDASSGRTGVPVTCGRGRSVPSKATALAAAKRPSKPLTAPGTAVGGHGDERHPGQDGGQPRRETGVATDDRRRPVAVGRGTSPRRARRPRPAPRTAPALAHQAEGRMLRRIPRPGSSVYGNSSVGQVVGLLSPA